MKKPLLLFIIFVILFVLAKIAYTKYCESKKEGCVEEEYVERNLPMDHVDY
jgi:hypothetical protein